MTTSIPIKLIVGLGNPGQQYVQTRHNCGARFVAALAHEYNLNFNLEKKFSGRIALIDQYKTPCTLLIPNTYMNHSGQSVGAYLKYFNIEPEATLIIHDEIELEPGVIRLKYGGGHAGHNGLRDIIHHINSREFGRLRLGVGHPGDKHLVSQYVLSAAPQAEQAKIELGMMEGLQLMPKILKGQFTLAMNQLLNRKNEL